MNVFFLSESFCFATGIAATRLIDVKQNGYKTIERCFPMPNVNISGSVEVMKSIACSLRDRGLKAASHEWC